jgi:exodeoxyribonuclease VII small subunit
MDPVASAAKPLFDGETGTNGLPSDFDMGSLRSSDTGSLRSSDPGSLRSSGLTALSFERAIQRLGEIVDSLEEGDQPLEESIALFEEGMVLAKNSQDILDRAERRIEELLGVDGQGKPVVREIEPD